MTTGGTTAGVSLTAICSVTRIIAEGRMATASPTRIVSTTLTTAAGKGCTVVVVVATMFAAGS